MAEATTKVVKAGVKKASNLINDTIIKRAVKTGKLKFTDRPIVYRGFHQSEAPVYYPDFTIQRWDVVNHGADPSGMFFTLDTPARDGFLAKRPFTSE